MEFTAEHITHTLKEMESFRKQLEKFNDIPATRKQLLEIDGEYGLHDNLYSGTMQSLDFYNDLLLSELQKWFINKEISFVEHLQELTESNQFETLRLELRSILATTP